MIKRKKMYLFLALGSITNVFGENNNFVKEKYDRFYKSITKSIDSKINSKNYKLLEKILEKRNKELKDLYIQGEYIVKPEYLEWQIFFSGFYNNKGRDGSKESVYNVGKREAKSIDLGMVIPVRGIERNGIEPELMPKQAPYININIGLAESPKVNTPNYKIDDIESPEVSTIIIPGIGSKNPFQVNSTGAISRSVHYNTSGNKIFENLNVNANSGTTLIIDGKTNSIQIDGVALYENGTVSGSTEASYVHTGYRKAMSVHNISNAGDFEVKGNWKLNSNNMPGYDYRSFLAYHPYYAATESKAVFSGDLVMEANNDNSQAVSGKNIALDFDLQSMAGYTGVKATLENSGIITLKQGTANGYSSVGIQVSSDKLANSKPAEIINSGTINVELDTRKGYANGGGVGIYALSAAYPNSVLIKSGNINIRGYGGRGIEIGSVSSSINFEKTPMVIDGSNGRINVEGESSIAIFVGNSLTSSGNTVLDNLKNMDIFINGTNSFGISNWITNNLNKQVDMVLNDSVLKKVEFGENSLNSKVIEISSGNVILDKSLENSIVPINTGTGNVIASGSSKTLIKNYMPINIGAGAKGASAIVTLGNFENYADVVNKSMMYIGRNGLIYGGIGLALGSSSQYGINKGNITMEGDNSSALYSEGGTLTSENDFIDIKGNGAVGVYVRGVYPIGGQPSETYITTDKISVFGDRSTALYSKHANITLAPKTPGQAVEIDINGKNSSAFVIRELENSKGLGKIKANGDVNVNLKNGAIGFYYENVYYNDQVLDVSDYIKNITDLSKGSLKLNADDKSFFIGLKNVAFDISKLKDIYENSGIDFNGIFRTKAGNSLMRVDIDSNIDKNNNNGDKTYRNMEISTSGIEINEGIILSGTEDGLIGIAQLNQSSVIGASTENKGIIDLTGKDSIGIYLRGQNQKNTGIINVKNDNGTGMYTSSGNAQNIGEINVGNKGTGIYSKVYDKQLNYAYSQVINSGKITAKSGQNAIGIYIDQEVPDGIQPFGNISLEKNSDIDMRASKGGIGIYSQGSSVTGYPDSGRISVGENGVALYANNSNVYLYNLELNLLGDNSVGIYTDGTTGINAAGVVNVDGKGIVVLNLAGSSYANYDFEVNSTEDSQYIFQNIKDRTLNYNSHINLGSGGTFLTGSNSVVLLQENSEIESQGNNMVGIALTGSYANGFPVNIARVSVYHEVTNKGNINFSGNNSTAVYVTNGASGTNQGNILVGDSSVALYGNGSGTKLENTGILKIGSESVAMYLKDGSLISNTGSISGTGDEAVGIFIDGDNNITGGNTGKIELTGVKTVGVYLSAGGIKNFNNTGAVKLGGSHSAQDPSIGIYNNNTQGTVNNAADIAVGNNSIGIYNKSGLINHLSGDIIVGSSGTGIYSGGGTVTLVNGKIVLAGDTAIGLYGINGTYIDNNAVLDTGSGSYGVVLSKGAYYTGRNKSTLGETSVFLYSDGKSSINNEIGADIHLTGSDSAGFYVVNGGEINNKADITGNTGTGNIGIYNKGGSIINSGNIKIGDSIIADPKNPFSNKYAVGLYGENAENISNSGNIEVGANGVGFYSVNNKNEALNAGVISSISEKAIGLYIEQGSLKNTGNITMSGVGSIGIAGNRNTVITNSGIITMNGDDSVGIYANANSKVINESTGKIYINGNNSIGVQLSGSSNLENYGLIEIASGTVNSVDMIKENPAYTPPSIVNAGIIKVNEKFILDGLNLTIKPDPGSFRTPTMEEIARGGYSPEDINGGFLLSNEVTVLAPSFDFGDNAVKIDPLFTQGTNARVYKFENVFDPSTPEGGANSGTVALESLSLTFDAVPVTNKAGKIDIWMEKINYDNFTKGSWVNEFAKNIEEDYLNATGEALKIYDKLDLITDENLLRETFGKLAGSMYGNIKQREQDIYGILDNALFTLQNSENSTKENIKLNVIAGKGNVKENTKGLDSYDYESIGVVALREVERTYRHKFGYSLGYTRTDFKLKNSYNEDEVNTIQLGLHNKYSLYGWNFKNDLLGRISFHLSDRSMEWYDGEKSNLSSDYNVYGINSLNEIEKDFEIGKNLKISPFTSLELGYMTHEGFEEKGGAEKLRVESNDGYTIKPSIGMRIKGEKTLGAYSNWKISGNVGISYDYELGKMNREESTSMDVIEEGYHRLAKAAKEKGVIKTSGMVGVELKDRYGIFFNGEYGTGKGNREDYKVGVSFKSSF